MTNDHRFLLDVPAAASRLGIGRAKFYEELSRGRIESVKIGRRRLVPVDALRRYVALLEKEAREDVH